MTNARLIITEDGRTVSKGDLVYNYYDMVPGRITSDPDDQGWFEFRRLIGCKNSDKGNPTTILNGQRICTIPFAVRRGFPDAIQHDNI